METYLTIKEAAELKGCSTQYLRKAALSGSIKAKKELNDKNRPQYLIPLSALGEKEQQKYMELYAPQAYPDIPQEELKSSKKQRTMEDFTEEQRKVIGIWLETFNKWKVFIASKKSKTEATKEFVRLARHEYPEIKLTVDILYRKYRESKHGEILEALVDKRGEAKKGKSNIPQDIKKLV